MTNAAEKGAEMTNDSVSEDLPAGAEATLVVRPMPGKTDKETLAFLALSPQLGAGEVIRHTTHPHSAWGLDVSALNKELRLQGDEAAKGDLSQLESMLAIQARTLDCLFTSLAARAGAATGVEWMDKLLRLAMKAQSQSRTTVETLAFIKQGPAVFARQANINNGGQQQVNNGVPSPASPATPAPARTRSGPTELLETAHGKRVDAGTKGAASGANPAMEAVGKINRASNRRRQAPRVPEPIPRGAA